MDPASRRCVLAIMALMLLAAACQATDTPSAATQSSPPTASEPATPEGPTFTVKQEGSDGHEVTVLIFDPTGSVESVRGANEEDEVPVIPSEVEPRFGPVPNEANQLRVLWGGGVCDTSYALTLSANAQGGYHIALQRGPLSSPSCDTLGVRRGVVLTFKSPVDAGTMSGALR